MNRRPKAATRTLGLTQDVVPVNFAIAGDELDRLRSAQPVGPWADGDREVYVVMEVEQISGRRIHPW